MNTIHLVRANAILPVVRFLHQNQLSSERFLMRAKLSSNNLNQSNLLIPLNYGFDFMEQVARAEGIQLLGIMASQQVQVEDFGLFGKVVSQSLTLYDLLRTITLLLTKTHNTGARAWLTQNENTVWFNHQYLSSTKVENQQSQYYACLVYLRVIQLLLGSALQPTELHFQASPLPGLEAFKVFSTTKVYFRQPNNAIGFSKPCLSFRVIKSSKSFTAGSDPMDDIWRQSILPDNFVSSLQSLVRSQLSCEYLGVSAAAEASGMSLRSFQRRLSEEGLSYSKLVDQVRFDLAVDLIQNSGLRLTDIAAELGYSNLGNFTRAFQRFAGVPPEEFRRRLLLQGDNV
jgi:AraC-like DNA-binding protein